MTQYIVSARKYRPDTFGTLVGQDNIAQTLKNSIVRGQLAHAYLFCGPRGVGKTSTARIFAKTINCSNPTADMEPCGECESCRSFAEGRSYCIHELDAASNNGVDDIKALMDQVRIPPQVGRYSVYIIDEVHMLSQSAFNAFLKTLEEPPAHAIFILATTEKHKILPTILSRCQTYDFNRLTVENIVKNLRDIAVKENINIDDESLHVIATKADGAMRDALTIFDQTVAFCGTDVKYQDVLKNLNVLDHEYSFSLVDAFLKGDYPTALLKFDEILAKGFNALHFIAALSSHFRDLIVSRSAALDALLELPESLKRKYQEQAMRCPLKFLYESLAITTACETGYRASVNPRLHIEFALMRLSMLMSPLAAAAPAGQTQVPQHQVAQPSAMPAVQPVSRPTAAQPQPADSAPPAKSQLPASALPVPDAPADKPHVAHEAQPAVGQVSVGEPKAEEPKRRTRASRSGQPTLSIKSLTEVKETVPVSQETFAANVELTEEQIRKKWQELAGVYASKPRLANTIATAELSIEDADEGKIVTFKVLNEAQKEWIREKCLHELEGNFQMLTSSGIRLRVDVIPSEDRGPIAYLPGEKAVELMNQNEEVKNLVSDFGLDIK
ncbi:MAG: DNA polymerase III subunit gamma/tau [Clostridium sp.]|nr:DNA polymerase III subunit gamma/tau [Bacteroides sp.]MCM1198715.1 DNA polymerase III subunit gamma/tau [Clostridium sp.]